MYSEYNRRKTDRDVQNGKYKYSFAWIWFTLVLFTNTFQIQRNGLSKNWCATKFHTHKKQQAKLESCTS
jgi:hypothetical protein